MKRATIADTSTVLEILISIHALVKRATTCHTNVIIYHIISIHALVKRATIDKDFTVDLSDVFQSTPS